MSKSASPAPSAVMQRRQAMKAPTTPTLSNAHFDPAVKVTISSSFFPEPGDIVTADSEPLLKSDYVISFSLDAEGIKDRRARESA